MRKRKILLGAVILFTLGFLHACDLIDECGNCKMATEQANGTTTYGSALPFCGDDLADRQNQSPVTVGGVTTYWVCN